MRVLGNELCSMFILSIERFVILARSMACAYACLPGQYPNFMFNDRLETPNVVSVQTNTCTRSVSMASDTISSLLTSFLKIA